LEELELEIEEKNEVICDTAREFSPRDWFSRAVTLSRRVVVPSSDRPLLGTATARTWQRVLASGCRCSGRGRVVGVESPATGWVADTVAQRSESAVEGGLSQVLRIDYLQRQQVGFIDSDPADKVSDPRLRKYFDNLQ
jgi:hypothetical protein